MSRPPNFSQVSDSSQPQPQLINNPSMLGSASFPSTFPLNYQALFVNKPNPLGKPMIFPSTPTSSNNIASTSVPPQQVPSSILNTAFRPSASSSVPKAHQRKKKRKQEEVLSLPEPLPKLDSDFQIIKELREFENTVDNFIMEKKLKIKHLFQPTKNTFQTLRIHVSHSLSQDNSKFTLLIRGELLDDAMQPIVTEDSNRKFTAFLERMIVDINVPAMEAGSVMNGLSPEDDGPLKRPQQLMPPIEWKWTAGFKNVDSFSITKEFQKYYNTKQPLQATMNNGDTPAVDQTVNPTTDSVLNSTDLSVKIFLDFKQDPPRYHISEALNGILDLDTVNLYSFNTILYALWSYIKVHNLQDPSDKKVINCDRRMQEAFHSFVIARQELQPQLAMRSMQKLSFAELMNYVKEQLQSPLPLQLDYVIPQRQRQPQQENIIGKQVSEKIVEYELELEDVEMSELLNQTIGGYSNVTTDEAYAMDIQNLDEDIALLVQKLYETKKRCSFFRDFSKDPVGEINRLIFSQTRDLAQMNNLRDVEESRYSRFYEQSWLPDAITKYFESKG